MKTLFVVVLVVLFTSALSYGQGHKQVSRIERVDFANFTFPVGEDCAGLKRNTVTLRKGEFKDKEVRFQLKSKILYADLTGEKINQAIVPLDCDTYGNFLITEIFFYTLRNGGPVLLAKLPESIIDRDYKQYYPDGLTWGISRVEANNGKLIIHKLADGYHACPENEARFEYTWNGKSFALAGKLVKYPLKNCGTEENPPSAPEVRKPSDAPRPEIVRSETFREGRLVFFRLFFDDPNNDAEGFGFRGAKGSPWAEENHPFSSPSYSRVAPGQIEYPFNLGCGTLSQYESDVETWIYDSDGQRSPSITVHLECIQ